MFAVLVYSLLYSGVSAYSNIAGEGTATQIDDWQTANTAELAIDGNPDGNWASGSITQTKTIGPSAWWKLTFQEFYYISSITIYNRLLNNSIKK